MNHDLIPLELDRPHDECGVFGIYAPGRDVARLTFFGLFALQHRGQESAGIASSDGRAAYIHVGALLGTLMTANVWFYVVPSQRALVAATKAGLPQDPALAYRAKQRSIHNNYMTFPVLFIMISNHFPSTYGQTLNWLILAVLMVGSAAVRHFMNIRFSYGGWLRAAAAVNASVLSPTRSSVRFMASVTSSGA